MTRPSRATASGRAYLDLQARARREGRPADELLTLYLLERILQRLSVSVYRHPSSSRAGACCQHSASSAPFAISRASSPPPMFSSS
jgi:hypothetical protein